MQEAVELIALLLEELKSFMYKEEDGRWYAGIREDADVTEAVEGVIQAAEKFLAEAEEFKQVWHWSKLTYNALCGDRDEYDGLTDTLAAVNCQACLEAARFVHIP